MDANPRAVIDVLRACRVATLVHGHTHRPAIHEVTVDGASARRLVLGAWYEQGSYLRWDARGFAPVALVRSASSRGGGPE